MADRFLIAPFKSGLVKNISPFLIPEDAFEELNNAYVFRGKVKKRFGSTYTGTDVLNEATAQLNSRLRVFLGNTDVNGDITVAVPAMTFKKGQIFSIGTEIFTILDETAGAHNLLSSTDVAATKTFDSSVPELVVTEAAHSTAVYFYPSEPVMGFGMYQVGNINSHVAYAYDTYFIYIYSGTSWLRTGTTVTFTGTNTQYFWTTNWDGITPEATAMFITNYNTVGHDNMYYTTDGTTFTKFRPKFLVAGTADQNIVVTARIIMPFKNRLILLNTHEVDAAAGYTTYTNRCRYSWNGSPIDASGYGWLEPDEDNYGGAGYIDAPTEEAIISAEFIRDRLIVYFETSTWELAYTGNEVLPFTWQKLNTELGSESTFSSVPFDKFVLNIGTTGIHACNGLNVERIDNKIPDEIYKNLNVNDAVVRVHGIRDYSSELVYWTLPRQIADDDNYYADKVLVYNYANSTWALNDDSITAFGYFEQTDGDTWVGDFQAWEDDGNDWEGESSSANYKTVIAGNQQGFVFRLDKGDNSNASVLYVSKVDADNNLTILNHNLKAGDYIKLSNMTGLAASANDIYEVYSVTDDNIIVLDDTFPGTAAYTGGGTAARVSRISIKSKQWNPYLNNTSDFYLENISFLVARTVSGEIEIQYYPSSSNVDLSEDGRVSGSNWGTYKLETYPFDLVPLEASQDRFWHTIYFQGYGSCVQIQLKFSDEQMLDESIVESNFELQGLILQTRKGNNIG